MEIFLKCLPSVFVINNTLPHQYPFVVGSACFGNEDIWGAALMINMENAEVLFTNINKEIKGTFNFEYKDN